MIVDLPSSTTSAVNRRLVELRESGGVLALGRVLTLVIVTDDGSAIEKAIEAGNSASREHPCRVIVLARGQRRAAPRLDAQIRVGGDAGASEVVVLRGYGPLAADEAGAGMVMPLLLPDAPVVAWWPGEAPAVPSTDAIGRLAQRRITDSLSSRNPVKAFEQRRAGHAAGDTDLVWTRLTHWRALLAAALDFPPHDAVTSATVSGEAVSPSTDLMAGWLVGRLGVKVKRTKADGAGMVSVRLDRRSGPVELLRPDGRTGTLRQPGQPDRLIALARRTVPDCLAEELRRLDPDDVYGEALGGLAHISRGRSSSTPRPPSAQAPSAPAESAPEQSAPEQSAPPAPTGSPDTPERPAAEAADRPERTGESEG
jgi:glucose-6-phosphate dehydrogenase assembly protein OpcA